MTARVQPILTRTTNFATEPSGVCRADSRIRLHPPPRPEGRPSLARHAGIDWQNVVTDRHAPANTPAILEMSHELDETTESVAAVATQAFDLLKRATEHVA
jgi:hypothetical protein